MEQADDIFQDSVVILFNQVRKGKFDEQYAIDAFIYTVARNLWLNKIRNDRRIASYEDMGIFHEIENDKDILGDLISRERSEAVNRLVGKLNEKCRELLRYYNHDGLSMKEISIKLGFSNEDVAKATHYKCKQMLMNLIKGNRELENLLKH
jgi:RNA polymerase sigma factor (sigma-70 family)